MEKDCIFCKIIRNEIPTQMVLKNDVVVAFKDIRPQAPVHFLIVPVKHIRSINDLEDHDQGIVSDMIMAARQLAKQESIASSGYKIQFNVEKGGGQEVFHLHMHLLGGWK